MCFSPHPTVYLNTDKASSLSILRYFCRMTTVNISILQFQLIFIIKTVHPDWDMTTILQKFATLYF